MMGEFHDAVTRLLGAFSCGISMIKAQRKNETNPYPRSKKAETQLSKSLKRNRLEVENAYGEDLVRYGPTFADGDAEAHSSLSKVLHRLNAVIKRFTSGKTTTTDYQTLLSLSNASRKEAINTFEQLSQRLSRSSLALVPLVPQGMPQHHHERRKKSTSNSKHGRSKSAPELSVTPQGLVRPKVGRKQSSDSSKSRKTDSANPRKKTSKSQSSQDPSPSSKQIIRQQQPPTLNIATFDESRQAPPPPEYTPQRRRQEDRKSYMSFASDSTKIGEIPEHKWARNHTTQANSYPITIYYPVEEYQQPEKQRSRLMKLFRR